MKVEGFKQGDFCWAELHTSDTAAAKEFYGTLFGWKPNDIPIGEGGVYTLCELNGANAAAMYQDTQTGAPPHWNVYVNVDSVDETAAKAGELGGELAMGPFDVMTAGRMAVMKDPGGAFFCIWQKNEHQGFEVVDEPGAACWFELTVADCKAAAEFYTQLIGYGVRGKPGEDMYTEWLVGEKSVGGLMALPAPHIPPHWTVYFQVADCDAATAQVKSLGGQCYMGPGDVPNTGRFSIVADPQGAVFALFTLAKS